MRVGIAADHTILVYTDRAVSRGASGPAGGACVHSALSLPGAPDSAGHLDRPTRAGAPFFACARASQEANLSAPGRGGLSSRVWRKGPPDELPVKPTAILARPESRSARARPRAHSAHTRRARGACMMRAARYARRRTATPSPAGRQARPVVPAACLALFFRLAATGSGRRLGGLLVRCKEHVNSLSVGVECRRN